MPSFIEAFLATHPHGLYPVVFFLLILAGLGFPISGDLVLLTCAYLAYLGKADLNILVPLCVFSIIAGDMIMFQIAKRYGMRLLKIWPFRKIFTEQGIENAKRTFQVRGYKVVFLARFMPGIRTIFMFTSGLMGLKFWKFALHDFAGGLIVITSTLHSVSWVAGNKDLILNWLQKIQWVVLTGVILFFTRLIVRKKKLKRLQKLNEVAATERS